MPGPIKPADVAEAKVNTFPEAVFEAFNELIIANFVSGQATVNQDEVVSLMVDKGLDRDEVYDKGWLNVEDAYRKAGWKVSYDKPGYNESYPATFKFSRK